MSIFIHSHRRVTSEGRKMVEEKKNECSIVVTEVKRLCKEFGFTAGMLQGVLAKGRNRSPKPKAFIGRKTLSALCLFRVLKRRRFVLRLA